MKHRIIPLLISCFVILTSMSECQKGEIWFLNYVDYSPINAELNGVLFTSGYYKYSGWCMSPFCFTTDYETGFYFSFDRDIVSGDDKALISLFMRETTPFELNRKYELGTEKTKGATVSFKKNGVSYVFSSIEGYIVFTECKRGSAGHSLSGYFEFTAVNEELGMTISVTNGTFENLWT